MTTVCVHGLGYIGLPTAAMLANHGYTVYGYDPSTEVRNSLQTGELHFDEPGLEELVEGALTSGKLEVTDAVQEAKYHLICVPTPFDERTKSADLSYITAAADTLAPWLREGDTVVLESTVPPGTTTDVFQPRLENAGLEAGRDFSLAHCPETVLPGNIVAELRQNNRIVGGIDASSTERARELYEPFVTGEIRTTADPTVAEFVKLIQNTARDVNIALANEIAKVAYDYDVDSREAIELANEHPRVDILQPGPGVGGHCLPIDPWFLGENSDQLELIATARGVNDGMAEFVVELLRSELGVIAGKKIAVLGVAYKGNVSDPRMSPALSLSRRLTEARAPEVATDGGDTDTPEIVLHDPHVSDPVLDLTDFESAITDADALVLTTDHDEYEDLNPAVLKRKMNQPILVDTKGFFEPTQWREAGFSVRRI